MVCGIDAVMVDILKIDSHQLSRLVSQRQQHEASPGGHSEYGQTSAAAAGCPSKLDVCILVTRWSALLIF